MTPPYSALRIEPPQLLEQPTKWWDSMADKSLIVGCYKHGYENYDLMRTDPTLSFITSCPLLSQSKINQTEQTKDDSNLDQDIDDNESLSMSKDCKDSDKVSKDVQNDSLTLANKLTQDSSALEASNSHDENEVILDDEKIWPSVVDLNTRLRRIISSYQRSVSKKDEISKTVSKVGKSSADVEITNPTVATTDPALNIQGWDLQQLAMYLLKMERREKMEAMVKERERSRVEEQKAKWSRREENEFFRVISTYGVNYDRKKAQYDWVKFKSLAKFDKKTDADLTDYYMSFRIMCKKVANMKMSDDDDILVDQLSPSKARQILDRVDLLSKIREEILSHPHLEERLCLCQPSGDTPDWWIPGKHDKELLLGAAKHGLGRTDITILNDLDFSFHKIVGKSIFGTIPSSSMIFNKAEKLIKVENKDDILKFDKNEILVKLEKGEGTLKIEKVAVKKDKDTLSDKRLEDNVDVNQAELTIVKTEDKIDDKFSNSTLTITTVPIAQPTEIDKNEEKETLVTPTSNEKNKSESENIEKNNEDLKIENISIEKSEQPDSDEIKDDNEVKHDIKEVNSTNEKLKAEENADEPMDTKEHEDVISPVDLDKTYSESHDQTPEIKDQNTEIQKPNENMEIDIDKSSEHSDNGSNITKTRNDSNSEKLSSISIDNENNEKNNQNLHEATNNVEEIKTEIKVESDSEYKPKISIKLCESQSTSEVNSADKLKDSQVKNDTNTKLDDIATTKTDVKKIFDAEDKCSVQAAELKAMFPDLEVIQPLSRLTQIDTFVLRDKTVDFPESTVAQLFTHNHQASLKWPKEHAIEARLMHIVHAIEHKEWPVAINFTAGDEVEHTISEKDISEVITITTDHGISRAVPSLNNLAVTKKRKRHIAIDVETERAKLHALLNNSHLSSQLSSNSSSLSKPTISSNNWDTNEDNANDESRRTISLQPPPAHQHVRTPSIPFEIKYSTTGKTTIIPGTSSTLTPIDLSSNYTKSVNDSNKDIMNEVQDFSMPSKNKQNNSNKGKLDSMLDKLMKRKNCPIDEPIIGKEKKRKKLDEIVLGLSAAKEQQENSHYMEYIKKNTITPNVTVTPASVSAGFPHSVATGQKPFSITVTSVPTSRTPGSSSTLPTSSLHSHKDNFSYSSKISSYSHEAKVNKWLAEQTAISEQLGAEYLNTPRRRRPRVDPSLLDWKKLTGEENVAVVNRLTGKKVTGSKAPQLKRLGQWLMENPIFDVDPKWAELVKERGNLPHDLQKRVPGLERSNNKGKSPGRPPMLPSPTSQASSNPSNLTSTSIASQLNFPGLSNSLLSTLSMSNFDPKNNPLLMPFGSLPNLGALGSLGNISNMNLTNSFFANLAGLGLPSLSGMESVLSGSTASSSAETSTVTTTAKNIGSIMSSNSSSGNSSKSRSKIDLATSKVSTSSTASSSSLPTTTPFPFFFPNPSLLYTPLGLGSLNPFSIQPSGVSSAYESLALLNSSASNASSSRKSTTSISNSRQKDFSIDSAKKKELEKKVGSSSNLSFRYPIDSTLMLQQYADFTSHNDDKKSSESEKKDNSDSIDIPDLPVRLDKKAKELEIKGPLDLLNKTSVEVSTKSQHVDDLHKSHKRIRTYVVFSV
ncbi:Similar to CHD7: Chromodomain-helicase-DNA-binding protein 7 (Homo sapiens) [Cotesia congregata]|uniref:Similar to CHD7: Chromodomain-helicase-DNA-binding protein 7 (Homo sapiens) n=1 Tax=Cotesia congregata TaxID=51543 RepID=A0A8J2HGT6_COTCN|nr:Similar to CHD7: Chromodomain-helicase-DNA-binding protein 7 (Homo sapiens) [Cotesia congregata]